MKNLSYIIIFTFTALITISCSKSTPEPTLCETTPSSWISNVNPIIQTFCNKAGCHDVSSVNGPGPLTNYSEVFSARSVIRVQVNAGLMPLTGNLTIEQKNAIICWIDGGAPQN